MVPKLKSPTGNTHEEFNFRIPIKTYMKAKILRKGFSSLEDKGTTFLTKRHAV